MLIKKYKSVSNTEYFDITEIGMDGALEGLSRNDLFDLVDGVCQTLTNEELLKALTIVEATLFNRSADKYEREAICEGA
jgi:hypothetical protein